ncbi:hypothetical protein VTH8203_01493 [Vibrio thalassae]|uniref:Uncharacterized protein n=1 Tax=Vibrio thalassae TaxID=1243014 RepID=A0A240EGQ8_9VIBR|nr:hypothetical protein [Vibrio thalassae]SNX47878.1 hypothetical protein VTH8203_01493 [Vibrio thalassae]
MFSFKNKPTRNRRDFEKLYYSVKGIIKNTHSRKKQASKRYMCFRDKEALADLQLAKKCFGIGLAYGKQIFQPNALRT